MFEMWKYLVRINDNTKHLVFKTENENNENKDFNSLNKTMIENNIEPSPDDAAVAPSNLKLKHIPKPSSQPKPPKNAKTEFDLTPLPRINFNQKYKLDLFNEMKAREQLYNEFCQNSRKFKEKFKHYRDQSLFSNVTQFRDKIKDIDIKHRNILMSEDRN